MEEASYHRGLHLLAILTAAATFPLIFMGGLVTSHGAGMSVPDWPNSYGYNMFTFPPNKWIGGIFYEHTHRLAGMLTGFLSILLVLWAWGTGQDEGIRRKLWRWVYVFLALTAIAAIVRIAATPQSVLATYSTHGMTIFGSVALVLWCATLARHREPRRWVRWLAMSILLAVIAQGILGGLRVVWVNLDLAIIHACTAQAFFCLVGLMIAACSRWWHEEPFATEPSSSGKVLIGLAAITVILIYLQLIAGALMRHYQAGLAIPDLPWAYGQYLPPTTAEGLRSVNQWRAWHPELHLEPVTLLQIWIHFIHRIGAVLVSLAVIVLASYVAWRHADRALIVRPTWLLTLLLFGQLTLGVLTVLWQKPADIASYHVAVGALALFVTFILGVRAIRLYVARHAPVPVAAPMPPAASTPKPLTA
jgi:cytochrome c oxidase assembly protein subunit 15